MAYDAINHLESDMVMIYDRYYCSFKMVALHSWQEKEIKFIIRGNENQSFIQRFIASKSPSEIVEMTATTNAIEGLKKSGFKVGKNTKLKVRLIRVELEKSIEVLVTNLWEEEGHLSQEFKDLYAKRWGIETNIGIQKNILQLESFSGQTTLSVRQDFFATVFTINLHSILIKNAQQTVDEQPMKKKYPLKINQNKSFGKLRGHIVDLFISKEPEEILKRLHSYFIRDPTPIRKGRSFARVIKTKQSKSKHKTFTNYKPAF